MSVNEERKGGGGRRAQLLKWLKILLALLLLAWVISTLSFQDRLTWKPPGGEAHSIAGEIVGDWKLDEVSFRPAADAELDPAWPAELRAAWARGEAAPISRAGEHPAFNWEPGMGRAMRGVDATWLGLGLALLVVALLGGVTRWWRLLALVGCPTSWGNTLRLTFLGLFFNLVMPGLTGGDLVKTVIVVRENPGRRAGALVSVAVDRIIGLFVLLALCAVMILVSGETFAEIRGKVLLVLALGVGGALVYLNGALRRLVRFDALLAKLPFGDKLKLMDQAVLVYSRHRFEMVMSVVYSLWNHTFSIFGVVALGHAFGLGGDQVSVLEWFALVPVANIVSSIPLAPGGWGVGEFVYKFLFEMIGAPAALGVAVSVAFRTCYLILSLIGGLFLLAPRARAELEEELEEIEELERAT